MLIKLKVLFTVFLFTISFCENKKSIYEDMYNTCGTSWQTSDMYFQEDDVLVFNLRFIYFAEAEDEVQLDYDSIMVMINNFYEQANIQFKLASIDTIINREIKLDMPSYVKYHFNHFRNDDYLTCYIYGDYQPNYMEDMKYTAGAAGGIGSNFMAVRKSFAYTMTMMHELGHNFGCRHTFEHDESEKGYTIYSGDRVCDTRYVGNIQEKINEKCEFTGNEDLQEFEKKQVACNFMSWNYFNCRKCMTNGQIRRMRSYIHESERMQQSIISGLDPVFQ